MPGSVGGREEAKARPDTADRFYLVEAYPQRHGLEQFLSRHGAVPERVGGERVRGQLVPATEDGVAGAMVGR